MKKQSLLKKRRGFTLLEVMVTLTILGFILLMIFGGIRLGLSAWHKGEEIQEADQQVRIGEQLLLRQIKSAFPYKIKNSKAGGDYLFFEGNAQTLKFISTYSLRNRSSAGLVLVTYEFQKKDDGEGILFWREQRVLTKDFSEEYSTPEPGHPLWRYIKDISFDYYQEEDASKTKVAEWVREWSAKERGELPAAVRLKILYGKETDMYPKQILLLVNIPASRWEEIKPIPGRRIIPQR